MAYEEIARFYTRSRRFPKLIGRMNDGSRIWGGPYTMTQVVVGGFAFLGAMVTRSLWTTNAMLLDLAITAGISLGAVYVTGFIPLTRRNLVAAFMGGVSAIFQPVEGKYQGKVPRLRRPHQVHGAALVLTLDGRSLVSPASPAVPALDAPAVITVDQRPARAAQPEPATLALPSAHTARVPMSAVERLLQQAKSTTKENS